MILDPEGEHLAALQRVADLSGRRIVELGCGDGRLTVPIARDAAAVFAFDPDGEAIERARTSLPPELAAKVTYRATGGRDVELSRRAFDVAVFSWSL